MLLCFPHHSVARVQEASDESRLNSTQAVLPNPPACIGRPVLSVLIQHGGKGGRKEAG